MPKYRKVLYVGETDKKDNELEAKINKHITHKNEVIKQTIVDFSSDKFDSSGNSNGYRKAFLVNEYDGKGKKVYNEIKSLTKQAGKESKKSKGIYAGSRFMQKEKTDRNEIVKEVDECNININL